MADTPGILDQLADLEAMARRLDRNFKRLEQQVATLAAEIESELTESPADDKEVWGAAVRDLSARIVDLERSVTKLIKHAHTHE